MVFSSIIMHVCDYINTFVIRNETLPLLVSRPGVETSLYSQVRFLGRAKIKIRGKTHGTC